MSYLWEKAERGLEAAAHQRDRANQPKRQRFSVKAAVAAHLDEDSAEIESDRRYQPTRTPCAVYTIGNDYLTATNGKRRPKGDENYRWIEIEAQGFAKLAGWRIWRRREEWE